MKLYLYPGACSTAAHIALQWTDQPFEIEIMDFTRIRSPAFLAINPSGKVPVLVDGEPPETYPSVI